MKDLKQDPKKFVDDSGWDNWQPDDEYLQEE